MAFKDQLARLRAYVFTLNAFPFGPFHGTRVKERVYEPDWRTGERVSFTRDAADILAALLPAGGFGSISTVPGGFKPVGREPKAVAALVDHLLQAAAHLVVIERRTGKRIALALEPEPCCFLETVEETLAFFEDALLRPAALGALRRACRARRRRGRADAASPSRRLLRRLPWRRRIRGAGRGAAPPARRRHRDPENPALGGDARAGDLGRRSRRGSATSTPASTCTR